MHLLDANAFIEANRLYYSPDLAPGFWRWVEEAHEVGLLASVKAVRNELTAGNDHLAAWAKQLPASFWWGDTSASAESLRAAAMWANDPAQPFTSTAVTEFMLSADLRLTAIAHANRAVVVTREISDPNCRRRVKLPDACHHLGVQCVQPFDAYRALGLQLT